MAQSKTYTKKSSAKTRSKTSTRKTSSTSANGGKLLMKAHENMMKKMQAMKLSGDADIDFAKMMKQHHTSGIEMAEVEIKNGKNAGIKNVAKENIESSKNDIKIFTSFLKKNKPQIESDFGEEAMRMMEDMSVSMDEKNVDVHFADMMIAHHKLAMEMAEAYLETGEEDEIKKTAANIIKMQTQEVKKLRALKKQHS